jgi:predicted nucleic acid-binding protein
VPTLIVTEVCFLAQDHIHPEAEARFLDSLVSKELIAENPTEADWARMGQLVRQWADFPLGVADAAVVATAERLNVRQIVTIEDYSKRAWREPAPKWAQVSDLTHCGGREF